MLTGQPLLWWGTVARRSLVSVDLVAGPVRELRIWSHQASADGWSSPLPPGATIQPGSTARLASQVADSGSPGTAVFHLDGRAVRVTVELYPPETTV
jgi:hypothetical protein